jgi:hypothetical protein
MRFMLGIGLLRASSIAGQRGDLAEPAATFYLRAATGLLAAVSLLVVL